MNNTKLEIKDLHVEVNGKEILRGITLTFLPQQVHVLMGPNGAGKSTLAYAVMGHPKYKITNGNIFLNGEDITHLTTDQRAKQGIFLSFQHPIEIPGVKVSHFLRTAINNQRKKKLSVPEFQALLQQKTQEVQFDPELLRRSLNENFSGGEKKRSEILQLLLLQPKYAFLDETDSGLDIDGMNAIAHNLNMLRHSEIKTGIIVITHYKRFLDVLQPDRVSILAEGRIVREGDSVLIKEIEQKGFASVVERK